MYQTIDLNFTYLFFFLAELCLDELAIYTHRQILVLHSVRHNPTEGSQCKIKHSGQSRVTETRPWKLRGMIILVLMPFPMY